jgi:hypothetical protein
MQTYDPRSISSVVYSNLQKLKDETAPKDHKEQKGQAVEIYNYLATWGLLRLKAEEFALSSPSQLQKKKVVECFFVSLQAIAFPEVKPQDKEPAQSASKTQSNQTIGLKPPPRCPNEPNTIQTNASNKKNHLLGQEGLIYLTKKELSASDYLGLMGLALQVAREFAFWAEAIYPKDKETKEKTDSNN